MWRQDKKIRKYRFFREEGGQALMELAIVLPLVIALLCGTIEFGWMCFNRINLANMAREGAREGILYSVGSGDLSTLETEILNDAPAHMKDKVRVDISYSNSSNPREGDVIVNIEYRASAITPLLGMVTTSNEYALSSYCAMKVE